MYPAILQKVKLVDAGFIWTEPHSKRLKVKLTIQSEVFNGTILQQGFVVEFIVENHMCLECNRVNANPNTWTACVQVQRRGLLVGWRVCLGLLGVWGHSDVPHTQLLSVYIVCAHGA
jgi:hypothetical protein